jgi:hypothetical protein
MKIWAAQALNTYQVMKQMQSFDAERNFISNAKQK